MATTSADRDRDDGASQSATASSPRPRPGWLSEGTKEFDEYVAGLTWAQDYAALNRDLMVDLIVRALQRFFPGEVVVRESAVNCHHNYASLEEHFGATVWVTRKGAVSARSGQLGIIPGSMGTKSFIVRGKGNPAAYDSCSHGAGRRMSRSEAQRAVHAGRPG